MKLRVNGEERDVPEGTTLSALLEVLALVPGRLRAANSSRCWEGSFFYFRQYYFQG